MYAEHRELFKRLSGAFGRTREVGSPLQFEFHQRKIQSGNELLRLVGGERELIGRSLLRVVGQCLSGYADGGLAAR